MAKKQNSNADLISLLNSKELDSLPPALKENLLKAAHDMKQSIDNKEQELKDTRVELNNAKTVSDTIVDLVALNADFFIFNFPKINIDNVVLYNYNEIKELTYALMNEFRTKTQQLEYSLACAFKLNRSEKIKATGAQEADTGTDANIDNTDSEEVYKAKIEYTDTQAEEHDVIHNTGDLSVQDNKDDVKSVIDNRVSTIIAQHQSISSDKVQLESIHNTLNNTLSSVNRVGYTNTYKDDLIRAAEKNNPLLIVEAAKKSCAVIGEALLDSDNVVRRSKADRMRHIVSIQLPVKYDVIVSTHSVEDKDTGIGAQINPALCTDATIFSKATADDCKFAHPEYHSAESVNIPGTLKSKPKVPAMSQDKVHKNNGLDEGGTLESLHSTAVAQADTTKVQTDVTTIYADTRHSEKDRQKQLKQLAGSIKHSCNAIVKSSDITASPIEHETEQGQSVHILSPFAMDPTVCGHLPMWNKGRYSININLSIAASFGYELTTKRRIAGAFRQCGIDISDSACIETANGFSRAFLKGVAEQIRQDILKTSNTIEMDECFIKVLEVNKKLKRDKTMLFAMRSGHTERIKAVYHKAATSRGKDEVIDILTLPGREKIAVRHLSSDALSSYSAAVRELADRGIHIKTTKCMQHAARTLLRYMNSSGLTQIYQSLLVDGDNHNNFYVRLKDYIASEQGQTLGEYNQDILYMFYLIQSLFIVEAEVAQQCDYRYDTQQYHMAIGKARRDKSKDIITALYNLIHQHIKYHKDVQVKILSNGSKISYKPDRRYFASSALTYMLKLEPEIKEYINDTHIALTTSGVERVHRLPIGIMRNNEFLASETGMHAFADYSSVVNTCMLNGVSVIDYFLWLVCNVKYRITEKLKTGYKFAGELMHQPRPVTRLKTDENGNTIKKRIRIYDSEYSCCFDEISYAGLTPYDYRKIIENRGIILN